jgi:hypothetical protein
VIPVTRSPDTNPHTAAADLAHLLAVPSPTPPERRWRAQSLAEGAAGIALLHVERAHAGLGGWDTAHAWLKAAVQADISAAADAGLYFGAPALAFVLHAADADGSGRYTRALTALDSSVVALTHRRIDQACARIDRGELPRLAEFDVISGLSGIGAHLLAHTPGNDALERVLSYLVRLTEPLPIDGETLAGWWTGHDPHFRTSPEHRGDHGNFGMAHGIAGPLALLALARRHGIAVDGHLDAIERICTWLDTWRSGSPTTNDAPDASASRDRCALPGAMALPDSRVRSSSPALPQATPHARRSPNKPSPVAFPARDSSAASSTPASATGGPGCFRPSGGPPPTRQRP